MKIGPQHGLAKLAQAPEHTPKEKQAAEIKEAAKKFEAFVTAQLFKQMSATNEAMSDEPSLANQFFGESLADHVAEVSAERGELGIAHVLEKTWVKQLPSSEHAPASMESLRVSQKSAKGSENFTKAPIKRADDVGENIGMNGDQS